MNYRRKQSDAFGAKLCFGNPEEAHAQKLALAKASNAARKI